MSASAALGRPLAARADDNNLTRQRGVWGDGGNYYGAGVNRIDAYSGGFERLLPHRTIRASASASPLEALANPPTLNYEWQGRQRNALDYLQRPGVTGLLIARHGRIWLEQYRHERRADMRMSGWSMAKSVTSLLVGIAIDRGLIRSLDDKAEQYDATLAGTLHGRCTLRQLMNMTSGAAVSHDADNGRTIYPQGLFAPGADLARVVQRWNWQRDAPGAKYNYNELAPLAVGMVLRSVSGISLSAFAQQHLWQAIGAEADATWQCDDQGAEFNCVGFAARLRDWARLGALVAERGMAQGRRVISPAWFDEIGHWRDDEAAVRFGSAMPQAGYKAFFWHGKADSSRLSFVGFAGQRVVIDMPSKTVLVQTAVDSPADQMAELLALFLAASAARES